MKIAYLYSHLNGHEHMMVHHRDLWDEIQSAISSIDANKYTKTSNAKATKGKILYDQKKLNSHFESILYPKGWKSVTTPYYVTSDISTAREIANIRDKNEQKRIISANGFKPHNTNNQVDFVKNRVAIEVQFGKYFSVAYDLHVKHTFFFLRNDIDVGIEIIPTKAMCLKMDSGVAWFENELANVIREGRSNPSVPIVLIGIEPEEINI